MDLVLTVAFIAVASFAVRVVWPFLDTGRLLGLNGWEYPQMLGLFVLGARAQERGWLVAGLPPRVRRACGVAGLAGIIAVAMLAVGIVLTDDPDPFLGGLGLRATLIPAIEAVLAVGMSLWIVGWFRRRWNRSSAIARAAGRGSFVAYLTHAPITIVLAAALRGVGVPAEVKFVVVFVGSVVAAFAAGWLVTRSRATAAVM